MITNLSSYLQDNPIFALLLICHFLSDFHLQTPEMAERKNKERGYFLYHLLMVMLPLVMVGLIIPELRISLLLIGLSHAAIDYGKTKIKLVASLSQPTVFALDQILHILIIFGFSQGTSAFYPLDWLPSESLRGILFFVLITKPTNIVFKFFFNKYQPTKEVEEVDSVKGAGALIGLLERVIMGICIIFGQFSSIGLVFTAKSIARYNKISENPAFAEYYLIGSLFSILSVLLFAWVCLF